MPICKECAIENLIPSSIVHSDGVTMGKLDDRDERNKSIVLADNTYATISLAEAMCATEQFQSYEKHDFSSHERGRAGWTKGNTWEESIELMTKRPQDLYSVKEDNDLILEEDSSGNQIIYDTTGDYLDVGRFLDGEPEVFGNASEGRQAVKYLNLTISASTPWNISSSDIYKVCAQVSQLVDWLEYNNVRCRVTVLHLSECCAFETRLKDYQEVLNMNELKIGLSTEYFRRIFFVFTEYSDAYESGYGIALLLEERDMVIDPGALNVIFNAKEYYRLPYEELSAKIKKMKKNFMHQFAKPTYKGKALTYGE